MCLLSTEDESEFVQSIFVHYHSGMLLNVLVETMDSLMNRMIKTTAFMLNRNLSVAFDHFNASLFNKSIHFFLKKKNILTQIFK